jgi:hypothetical protein
MEQGQNINIFVAHTPFHVFVIDKIIKSYDLDKNVNFMINSIPLKEDYFDESIFIDKKDFFKKVINTVKAKRKILHYLNKKELNITFYIAHTDGLIDNYIYFSLMRRYENMKINLYYDGILSFYDYKQPYVIGQHIKRSIYAILNGFLYKYSPDIIPLEEDRIHKVFNPLPHAVKNFAPEKVSKFNLKPERYIEPISKRCLILGGFFPDMSTLQIIAFYEFIIKKAIDEGMEDFFLKRHHSGTLEGFEEIEEKYKISFNVVDLDEPVEDVLYKISPSNIYSYQTTALINLKIMFEDSIKLTSFSPANFGGSEDTRSQIDKVFETLGIEVIRFIGV